MPDLDVHTDKEEAPDESGAVPMGSFKRRGQQGQAHSAEIGYIPRGLPGSPVSFCETTRPRAGQKAFAAFFVLRRLSARLPADLMWRRDEMSFVKALAAVAMGFAAAKGMDKYKDMGGMAGMQDALKGAGTSDMANQLGQLADRFGIPGGSDQVKSLLDQLGKATADASEAGAAGLGGLMASMQGAAEAGSKHSADLMQAMFAGTPAADAMEEQAKLMIRAMIQAAKADGEIDQAEQSAILDRLGDISDEERAFVQAELRKPSDLHGLVQDAGAAGREQIYATSLAAIRVDNAAEAAYLRQLAGGLGLSDAQRDAIHTRMGIPPLSA